MIFGHLRQKPIYENHHYDHHHYDRHHHHHGHDLEEQGWTWFPVRLWSWPMLRPVRNITCMGYDYGDFDDFDDYDDFEDDFDDDDFVTMMFVTLPVRLAPLGMPMAISG